MIVYSVKLKVNHILAYNLSQLLLRVLLNCCKNWTLAKLQVLLNTNMLHQ